MPHGKRTTRNYEKELKDAIKRIKQEPEYETKVTRTSSDWINFLIDVLGFNPASVLPEPGSDFWEKARLETEYQKRVYTNPKTGQVSYRNIRGQWTENKEKFR